MRFADEKRRLLGWLALLAPLPLPLNEPRPMGVVTWPVLLLWVLAMAYSRGAFTAVYPIVRGTGPLVTVVFAGVVFGEFTPVPNAGKESFNEEWEARLGQAWSESLDALGLDYFPGAPTTG